MKGIKILLEFYSRLVFYLSRKIKLCYYKSYFASFGDNSFIDKPLRIGGAENIYIGKNVNIHYKTWLESLPLIKNGNSDSSCSLLIDDGCVIGHFNHIYSTKSVVLHKNVLTADKVYISDNLHGYENISQPILIQSIVQNGTVEIGEGSWLGENVCVLGANIGKNCVIGANSVVTKDIPDYCVAVGVPAKIIKRYDFEQKKWIKIT